MPWTAEYWTRGRQTRHWNLILWDVNNKDVCITVEACCVFVSTTALFKLTCFNAAWCSKFGLGLVSRESVLRYRMNVRQVWSVLWQGSVEILFRRGEKRLHYCTPYFIRIGRVLWKIWQNTFWCVFFDSQCSSATAASYCHTSSCFIPYSCRPSCCQIYHF